MSNEHDKVKLIIETTTQHVMLLDPDDPMTKATIEALQRSLTSGNNAQPPSVLGKRGKKGRARPLIESMGAVVDQFEVMTGMTYVIPDETGAPSLEFKITTTTMQRKPVTA